MKANYHYYHSPIGKLIIVADTKNILGLVFAKNWAKFKKRFDNLQLLENSVIRRSKKQLTEYFAGKRRSFSLPYVIDGSSFQTKAWTTLGKIPYGQTCSYKQQASMLKSPLAVRAVGKANGLNPICIILPCHRIIGSNGSLTGYAGGLKAKQLLLRLEGSLGT